MSKIRIAFLVDTISCETAGTEKQLLQAIKCLDMDGFEPLVIALWQSEWMKKNALPCKVVVLEHTGFVKSGFPAVLRKLICLTRTERLDIVHTFFEESVFVAYLARKLGGKIPVLLASRRDIGLGSEQPWYHRLFELARAAINNGVDGIVVNGSCIKRHIVERESVSEGKIKVIHNGITLPDKEQDRIHLFEDDVEFAVGIVANLRPVKRIDVFVKSMALLRARFKGKGIGAIVIGDGPEKAALLELSKRMGVSSCVRFVGSVKNVFSYLREIDVGVLCSDREGFSNAILEYMACALPVVATQVGGNPELVDDSNGVLVRPGDVEGLANALAKLGANPELRRRLGDGSLEKVREHFSWKRTIRELEEYYRGLVVAKAAE